MRIKVSILYIYALSSACISSKGMDALCVLVLVVLASGTSGYHCAPNCDPETGLRKETLYSTDHSYKDFSQCADPDVCDNSTPGTGHTLFADLTEDLIAVERCYSFCYNNVRYIGRIMSSFVRS